MSSLYENNSNEDNEISKAISPFSTDRVFESRDELMEWVQNTANSIGYVIVTRRSKAKESGVVSYVTLICDRGREYKGKETCKKSGTKKTNCKFQLVGSYKKQYDGWTLRVICDDHNHPPAQHMEGHAYVGRLKKNEKQLVEDLSTQNVMPREILSALKEHDENNVSTLRTIYNARLKLRLSQKVGKTPMQVIMGLLNDKHFLIKYTVNEISNELENLFFVHPLSLDMWRAFPHVLLMDATYKTNKYRLPFVQIVGVTSTRKTFSIAFAFIINEREDNYKWALTRLKLTLDKCMHPRVIVTDRDLALMNACKEVYPDATRLLCRWHISENIKNNCRQTIKSQGDWDSFRTMWTTLVDSPTLILYTENYRKLQSMLMKYPRVLNYLDQTWLSKYKEMFVSVWIDQHLNFGERTTNRVESQHAKLKGYLGGPNSNLDKFVGSIDRCVKSQRTTIYESFEKSRILVKHEHKLPCFRLLRGFVSLEALDILVGELQRLSGLQLDSSNCGCKLRHSCGLPCGCMLSVYLNSGECIPLDSIDIFWRTLDLEPSISVENEDIYCDGELEKFKEIFTQQSEAGKRSMLRKLRDILQPSKTLVKEPAIQTKRRGRPSLKKQQKKQASSINQPPKRCSYSTTPKSVRSDLMESREESTRHSSPKIPDLNEEPQSCFRVDTNGIDLIQDPLMNEIPREFHPYVEYIRDVKGDGNCGFRSIVIAIGRSENDWRQIRSDLYKELSAHPQMYAMVYGDFLNNISHSLNLPESEEFAAEEYWLVMPDTAILIANIYCVIVIYLTKTGSSTWFPHRYGPQDIPNPKYVVIAHVHRVHYVMVSLQGTYPMPPVWTTFYRDYRSEHSAKWETLYTDRLLAYVSYNSHKAPRKCNTEPIIIPD